MLSEAPGAGEQLHGGFVVYTKEQKTIALGVAPDLLDRDQCGSVGKDRFKLALIDQPVAPDRYLPRISSKGVRYDRMLGGAVVGAGFRPAGASTVLPPRRCRG